jgi:DNA sulfur modification protein DndE
MRTPHRLKLWFWLSVLFVFILGSNSQPPIRIFLIGDSTMADKPIEGNPERGWGQMFPTYFDNQVMIFNHAVNGRSTKSFIREGRWQKVLDSLRAGDYVMIQFGHNDQKDYDTTRYAAPFAQFKQNIENFISESRAKGAYPILITPVMRRSFDEIGNFHDTHGDYPLVVRQVAIKQQVPLVDLHRKSEQLIIQLGVEESKKIFLWVEPNIYSALPKGKQDDTHFSEYGANCIAGMVAQGLKELKLPLAEYLIK